jgi:hypothetical protein
MWLNDRLKSLVDKYKTGLLNSYYQDTFNNLHGKAVLDDLTAFCKLNAITKENESLEFNEGRRSVILYILDMLNKPVLKHIKGEENE